MIEYLKELNVLYIDDDKIACKNMENTLSYFFKNVFIEHNGLNAIDTYKKEHIHLLLVDYDMPLMNGVEFLQEIRQKDLTIPALIISSYSDKEKLMNAIKLNLVSYLVKPLDFSELKSALEESAFWMEKYNLLKVNLGNNYFYNLSSKSILLNEEIQTIFTNFESRIFEYLLRNKNQVISYDDIFYLLDSIDTNKRSLASIIYKINKKLPNPLIKSIKEVGYTLVGIK